MDRDEIFLGAEHRRVERNRGHRIPGPLGGIASMRPTPRRRELSARVPPSEPQQSAPFLRGVLVCHARDVKRVELSIESCVEYLGGTPVLLHVIVAPAFPFWAYCEPHAIGFLRRDYLESIDALRSKLGKNDGLILDSLEYVEDALSRAVMHAAQEVDAHAVFVAPPKRGSAARSSLEKRVRRSVVVPVVRLL